MSSPRTRVLAPAQMTGGAVPYVQTLAYVTGGDDFIEGSILSADASDPPAVEEYSTTPLVDTATGVVIGVALQAKDSNPGFELGHNSDVIASTGISSSVSAVIPNRNMLLSISIDPATDGSVTDYQVLVGRVFNLNLNTVRGSDVWQLDANTTGASAANGAFHVEKVIDIMEPGNTSFAGHEIWVVGTLVPAVLAYPDA